MENVQMRVKDETLIIEVDLSKRRDGLGVLPSLR